jgi:6-phosphogluconate dehydrogenase
MQLGMIGLGRMGGNMVRRLLGAGHECVVYDVSPAAIATLVAEGAIGAATLDEFVAALRPPRAVWLMVPAALVDAEIEALSGVLAADDVLIDGGNSHYHDDIRRADGLRTRGIHYLDVGTSGGVWGLERGYCLMIGGPADQFARLEPIFKTLAPGKGKIDTTPGIDKASHVPASAQEGYLHCGPAGAGHFVKMVHNGIEYGLMQAFAEGFDLMRSASKDGVPDGQKYDFNVAAVAEVWRRGSVVASWLLDLTSAALAESPTLDRFTGHVSDSGEGRWTIQTAVETAVPVPVLAEALFARFRSRQDHTFGDKLLSAMREQFGGHREQKEQK